MSAEEQGHRDGGLKISKYSDALSEAQGQAPDWGRVQSLLQEAMEEGDMEAAYALGTWYFHGHHLPQDIEKGVRLIEQAANKKVPAALNHLAMCYEKGEGKTYNARLAAENYLMAALYGDEQSFVETGRCLFYGIGFLEDRSLAKIWYEKAESLGRDVDCYE